MNTEKKLPKPLPEMISSAASATIREKEILNGTILRLESAIVALQEHSEWFTHMHAARIELMESLTSARRAMNCLDGATNILRFI